MVKMEQKMNRLIGASIANGIFLSQSKQKTMEQAYGYKL